MDWSIILIVLTAAGAIFAFSNNLFNHVERFKKWKQKKKKNKYKSAYIENNPDFEFRTGYISNSPPGICKLTISIINRSLEVKYINMVSYNFKIPNNDKFLPPCQILRPDQFPKRLENGEPFYIQEDFHNILFNTLYNYWKKDAEVFATCNSTVGDHLRSNSLEYDKLVERLIPIKKEYKRLTIDLHIKFGGSLRDIEVSLWQLQLFDRMTSGIAQQLQNNQIPILQILNSKCGLVLKDKSWYDIYKELEMKKIPPNLIFNYLNDIF